MNVFVKKHVAIVLKKTALITIVSLMIRAIFPPISYKEAFWTIIQSNVWKPNTIKNEIKYTCFSVNNADNVSCSECREYSHNPIMIPAIIINLNDKNDFLNDCKNMFFLSGYLRRRLE